MNTNEDKTTWSIKDRPGTGYNDEIRTHRHPSDNAFSVEDDGYPVVMTESGIDENGMGTYYEQREIVGPAETWDEAKEQVAGRISDDEEISEKGVSGLQSGGRGHVDYFVVEVLTPDV